MNNSKIIDAFPYFNEAALLKTRLEYLGPYVDKFIIFESSIDFSGRPRKLFLNKFNIEKLPHHEKIHIHQWHPTYLQKIYFYLSAKLKYKKGLWKIQNKQRNSITKALKGLNQEDILIFGDLDEFPDVEILKNKASILAQLEANPIFSFSQTMYYYDTSTVMDNDWRGSIVCKINTAIKKTPRRLRKYRLDYPEIGKGWHFSYFSEPAMIKEKILAIADAENLSMYKSITTEEIKTAITESKDRTVTRDQ